MKSNSKNMGGSKIRIRKRKSDWLSDLLRSEFFSTCIDHQHLRKNEKNVFCISCSHVLCRHCVSSSAHCLHTWLQVCKYVYHDVVRLQDIQKHLDCSEIQTYKINGEKAIHLNPRPQLKDSNSKTPSKIKSSASCQACGRYIQDLPNRFCSIACKVLVFSNNSEDEGNGIISFSIPNLTYISMNKTESTVMIMADSPKETQLSVSSALKPRRQLRKRKGVPIRSPLS